MTTLLLYTPEQFKHEIDLLAKTKGFKFFVISGCKDGTAHANSPQNQNYRIPVAIPNVFAKGKMNLSTALQGFYFIGVSDIDVLSGEHRARCEEDMKKESTDKRTEWCKNTFCPECPDSDTCPESKK